MNSAVSTEVSPTTILLEKLASHVLVEIAECDEKRKLARTPVMISRSFQECVWLRQYLLDTPGMWTFDHKLGLRICLQLEQHRTNMFYISPVVVALRAPDNTSEHVRLLHALLVNEPEYSPHHVISRIASIMSPARYHVSEFEHKELK